ncbi:MAG: SHOCT domain-containing protein [Acidobacteriota bacterium]
MNMTSADYDKLEQRFTGGCRLLFAIAVVNIALGVLEVGNSGVIIGGIGVVFLFLGLLAGQQSLLALKVGIGLFAVDALLGIAVFFQQPQVGAQYIISLPVKFALLGGLIGGLRAGLKLREEREQIDEPAGLSFATASTLHLSQEPLQPDVPPTTMAGAGERSKGLGDLSPRREDLPSGVAERLRQLASLKAEGLITTEEFEDKRKELLERL